MDAAGAVIWMEFRFANDMVSLKCPSLCYLAPEANWSSLSQGLASFWEISGVREKGGKVSRYSCSFALWSIHRFLKQRGLGINIYRSSDGTGSIDTEWERAWWIIIIHLEYLLPPLSSSLKWRWAQGEQRRVEWRRRRAEAERERERQTEIHSISFFSNSFPGELPQSAPCHLCDLEMIFADKRVYLFGSIWKWMATLFHIKHMLSWGGIFSPVPSASPKLKRKASHMELLPWNTLKLFWKSNYWCFL